jgi:hypothetical protein
MMSWLTSFLILLLNLVILGVIYWGVCQVVGLIPAAWVPDNIKGVLLTILKVIVVIIAVIWIASWLIGIIGGGGFGVPMFYHRH